MDAMSTVSNLWGIVVQYAGRLILAAIVFFAGRQLVKVAINLAERRMTKLHVESRCIRSCLRCSAWPAGTSTPFGGSYRRNRSNVLCGPHRGSRLSYRPCFPGFTLKLTGGVLILPETIQGRGFHRSRGLFRYSKGNPGVLHHPAYP